MNVMRHRNNKHKKDSHKEKGGGKESEEVGSKMGKN